MARLSWCEGVTRRIFVTYQRHRYSENQPVDVGKARLGRTQIRAARPSVNQPVVHAASK